MADGASIGEVHVDVSPRLGDWARFRAEMLGQGAKVGDDLGDAMGKRIADQIAKGIRDGLGKAPKEPATRSGTESGGAFADGFKKRVDAALKSLPKIQIGAAADEAEQKIRDLRGELAALSDKKVGVDIGAAEAVAELDRIRAALDEVGSRSPNVQVRADAAAAAAQLATITAEVDRLDGRNVNVQVDADTAGATAGLAGVEGASRAATGGVSNLVAAGIALGPALVPGAAAAAAAIAGIGPAAIGALGGLGALALAFSGVVGAVKAMGAADDQATQSGASLAKNSFQQAAAADAVRQAQAALANTTANAADQQRRAAESVANAERSLGDARINAERANEAAVQAVANAEQTRTRAQRDALQAQKDLTQAAQDAKRANEDLANQVIDNGFAQQRAVLAVHDAQQKLNAVLSNPQTTTRQRQEAQLTFDEAKQHLLEIGQAGDRLAADKAKADTAGINGSKQVVAATKRVQDSQQSLATAEQGVSKARADAANTARTSAESVAKAQQAVADAQAAQASQARQSAFSIAQAQQAVVAAQRGVQTATVSAGTAGGAAMRKLSDAMKDLSPQGREFAAFIFALKAPLLDLRRTAEAGVLPGVEDGIKSMLTVLPTALTLTGRFATSVGNMAAATGRAFSQPYWVNFATDLTNTAIPAMENMGRVAYNLAIGVSGLVHAFLPLSDDIGGGLLKFSRDFAAYGLTLENTAGYRAFLDYVRTVGPEVVQTVSEVAQAVIRIVQAVAPIGGVSLTSIRLFAEAINALPIPVLTALAGGIVAVTTATKLLSYARLISETKTFIGLQLLASQTMGGFRTGLAGAGPEAGRFATAVGGIRGAATGAATGVGSLLGMVGLGGPLGIGLVAGTILITAWANHHADAAAKIAKHKSAVDEINGAIKANSGLIDENVRKVAAKNAYDQGALQLAQKAGISLGEVTNAYISGGTAIDSVVSKIEAYIASEQRATQTDQAHSTQHTQNIKTAREVIDTLIGQKDAVANSASETAKATEKQRILDEAMKGVGSTASTNLTPTQIALGQALRTVSDASSTATDRANALKTADDAVFGAARNAITAEQDQALVLLQVAAAGKQNADQQLFGKATLDLHSEASIRNRQMLEQRFLALGQQYIADVQSGVAVDAASKKHDTNRDAIIKAAEAAGFDSSEVHKLSDTFGTLPTNPKVQVTVAGVSEALTQLQNLEIAQLALKQGLDPAEATRQWKAQHSQAQNLQHGLAMGGPVHGPGGPTEDKIPVWLSNGEHVITAREVQAAGGHGAIEQIRRMLLGRRQPQALYPGDGSGGLKFAGGGAVTWPFPATAAHTKIPSLEDVKRVVYFGPNFTGDISGGLAAAIAFVQHQVGKPYGWAMSGPGSFDCSGLVGAAWQVAHGRNPYSRIFSTMNEAPFFPLAGYGPFTAGWTNPGEAGVGGGAFGVGHTAAKIGNFAFESVGGQGVRTGSSVTPLGRFAHIGHYDSGGVLPPGLTIARNDTGTNEFVFTGDQLKSLGGGGPQITQHIYPQRGQSEPEIAAAASRQLAWELR